MGITSISKNSLSLSNTIIKMQSEREKVGTCAWNWRSFVIGNFKWKDAVKEIVKVIEDENTPFTRKN